MEFIIVLVSESTPVVESTKQQLYKRTDSLMKDIDKSILVNDYIELTQIFEARIAILSPRDANIIVTRTFRILSKPGYWALSKHVLDLIILKDFPLDTVTQTAAMTLCIRFVLVLQ